jgi:hypothetical protein
MAPGELCRGGIATRIQLSAGAGGFVNAPLHHTLALGEIASPDARYDADSVPRVARVDLTSAVCQLGRSSPVTSDENAAHARPVEAMPNVDDKGAAGRSWHATRSGGNC